MTRSEIGEPIIEPDLPIIDTHHHLWMVTGAAFAPSEVMNSIASRTLEPVRRRHARYLFDELLADFTSGHNVRASVFVEGHALYRASGPDSMKSVGEVDVANGVAAMSASGLFGGVRICAGIVGGVNLRLGDAVAQVLAAHLQAGGARYRGVRDTSVLHDDDASLFGAGITKPHILLDSEFRAGFRHLEPLGLSCDLYVLEPQLPEVVDLAQAFPNTPIVVNHTGGPVGMGRYAGRMEQRFPIWRDNIDALSRCANVSIKLGGLGMPLCGFSSLFTGQGITSTEIAREWKPYIETCIEAFGVHRCMFESNFPVDAATCSYPMLWNAFKRITAGASNDEKAALFSGTAAQIYRLDG